MSLSFNNITEKISKDLSKTFNQVKDIESVSNATKLSYDKFNVASVTNVLQSNFNLGGYKYDMGMLDNLVNQIINETVDDNLEETNSPVENTDEINTSEELSIKEDESKENYTDPIVEKSPTIGFSTVVVPDAYAPDNIDEEGELNNEEINTNNTEEFQFYEMGYTFPLINFNGRILQKHEIAYLEIAFDDVSPTFELGIFDLGISTNNIKQVMPGMENEINIKIRPSMNGKYKTALLDFFITDVVMSEYNYKPIFKCKGSYKLKELYDGTPKSISIESGSVVNNSSSNSESDEDKYKLSTYDYLMEIAFITGLGFQATEDCPNINDKRLRYKQNETYIDFIKKQLSISGLDEHSIFDCWVNMYGSLTLVNVAWIFDQASEISPNYLKCYANVGVQKTDGDGIGQEWKKIDRTLTNLNTQTMSNMKFNSNNYIIISDNSSRNEGLNTTTMTMNIVGTGAGNNGSISNAEIQCIDNSVDGINYKDNYNIKSIPDIEVNMSSTETNIIEQRNIRKGFFNIKRSKRVMLTLDEFNFALDRGYLINIAYFVTNKNEKSFIIRNITNIEGDESIEKLSYSLPDGKTVEDILEDDNYPMLDMSKSGIFYIDKMYIKYDNDIPNIRQVLDLIKIGDASTYQNKYSYQKFVDDYTSELQQYNSNSGTSNINITGFINTGINLDQAINEIINT